MLAEDNLVSVSQQLQ